MTTGQDMADPIPDQNRVRASEARKVQAGGRRMPGGVMPREAAEALDQLQAAGYGASASACIHRALVEAAGRAAKAKARKKAAKKAARK
jgi:hypothetical protein